MRAKLLASCLLVAVSAAGQDANLQKRTRSAELNGGLHAEVISLGRNNEGPRPVLTASIKITNTGTNYVYLLFIGTPAAVDENGVKFDQFRSGVSGAAYCNMSPAQTCAGIPDESRYYPLRGHTEIDPGKSITVLMSLSTFTHESKGDYISLAGEYAYRIVNDRNSDVELSAKDKLRHQIGRASCRER